MRFYVRKGPLAVATAVAVAVVSLPIAFDGGPPLPSLQEAVAGNHSDRGNGGDRGGGRDGRDDDRGRGGRGSADRPSHGHGHSHRGEPPGLASARQRYERALEARSDRDAERAFGRDIGAVAATLDDEATRALIDRGWTADSPRNDGFRNHGDRVSTFVELAKTLGYDASVGALQANFGAGAAVDPAAPPGNWPSADLDVDDDGVVTRADLQAARAAEPTQ